MKIKFTSDAWVNGELFAKAGDIKDVPEEGGSASRWIRRGAIIVSSEEKVITQEYPKPEKIEEPPKEEPVKEDKPEEVKSEDFLEIEKPVAKENTSSKPRGRKPKSKE